MKAEDIDSPAQGREPRRDQGLAMMRGKRSLDDAEISLQRVRARIGFSGRDGMARDFAAGEREQGCREPCIDANQGTAIGFVAALRIVVAERSASACSSGVQLKSRRVTDSSPPKRWTSDK